MANVRRARPEDFPVLVELGRAMQQESPRYRGLSFVDERCLKLLGFLCTSPHGVVLVAENDGQIVGMIVGFASQHFFSEDWTAGELVVYVTPEYRGGSCAVKLIRQYEEWAMSLGVKDISLGISTEIDTDRTADFYGRMGYLPSGRTMVKRCA